MMSDFNAQLYINLIRPGQIARPCNYYLFFSFKQRRHNQKLSNWANVKLCKQSRQFERYFFRHSKDVLYKLRTNVTLFFFQRPKKTFQN